MVVWKLNAAMKTQQIDVIIVAQFNCIKFVDLVCNKIKYNPM